MNHSMIVWCVIVGILLFVFVFRALEDRYATCRHKGFKIRHLVEFGKERDIFYVPGDEDDDDYEEF